MYKPYPVLRTPPDETKLWRYVDLSHFLSLLSRRALYFANLAEFDDLWEGALPAGSTVGLIRTFAKVLGEDGTDAAAIAAARPESFMLRMFKEVLKSAQGIYGVNCWHCNEVESVAMWKLYTNGKDGVAIQSTVGRLKACLSHEPRNLFIAEVQYRDHHAEPTEESISHDALLPLITKRRSFAHESEVRLLLDRRPNEFVDVPELRRSVSGESVAVDLPGLVERIVASPDYPQWALTSLQDIVATAGLDAYVEKSDLLRRPELPDTPHPDEDTDSD